MRITKILSNGLKTSEIVHKTICIKVFIPPDNRLGKRIVVKSKPGTHFTPEGIENLLLKVANDIETKWPMYEFRLVPLRANEFNFVYEGDRIVEEVKAVETNAPSVYSDQIKQN